VNPNSFFGEGGNARDRKWMSGSALRRNHGREAKRASEVRPNLILRTKRKGTLRQRGSPSPLDKNLSWMSPNSHEQFRERRFFVEETEHLIATRWNRKQASAMLQIDYKALLYKMKKLGLDDKPAGEGDDALPGAFFAGGA
jgi:DNA-binding NtrC family response regulator